MGADTAKRSLDSADTGDLVHKRVKAEQLDNHQENTNNISSRDPSGEASGSGASGTEDVQVKAETALASENNGSSTSSASRPESGATTAVEGSDALPAGVKAEDNGDLEGDQGGDDAELEVSKNTAREKRRAEVTFQPVHNHGDKDNAYCLTMLKNIVQRQLPKMPKEYITRLIFAKNHYAMVVRKKNDEIVGGIVYLPFVERNFAEIVFLAIDNTKQTQGYGSGLMAHFKDYLAKTFNITNCLTYADNFAIGYFKKQGFTLDLTLDRELWMGYIKDYEGATLLQCSFYKEIKYAEARALIAKHRRDVLKLIKGRNPVSKVYPGLTHFENSTTPLTPDQIPGVVEAGWSKEYAAVQEKQSEVKSPLFNTIMALLEGMKSRTESHPFLQPVTGVLDYYEIIKFPMDLQTATDKLNDNKYTSMQEFANDIELIWSNCKTYNAPETSYVKNANSLWKWFKKHALQKCKANDVEPPVFKHDK